jgi:hypothetical protein
MSTTAFCGECFLCFVLFENSQLISDTSMTLAPTREYSTSTVPMDFFMIRHETMGFVASLEKKLSFCGCTVAIMMDSNPLYTLFVRMIVLTLFLFVSFFI